MDEEASVLTNRQLGFEIKAANNMIRRKIDAIFAQQEGYELNGMQGPLLGYLYHKSRHGEVYQDPQIHSHGNAPKPGTEGLYCPGGIHRGRQTETDPVDGKSN